MREFLKKLMSFAPGPLADWARVAYDFLPPGVRYGKAYREFMELLRESERWDASALREYQEARLRVLVRHCFDNVPYYRAVFDSMGIGPGDVETLEDLSRLPFLDKRTVRANKRSMLARNVASLSVETDMTSGTTAAPLDFFIDLSTRAMERALAMRQLEWLGYAPGDVIAEIKEDLFSDPDRCFIYYPASRQVRFSFFQVDDQRLARIFAALERFRPAYIKAFPSSLHVLSKWMERNHKSLDSVKFVLTSSENLYPSVIEIATRVFNAPVVDHYGQNEQVAYAFQCAEGDGYHIQTEQCILELVPKEGGALEIVGTSLHNMAMPFLRYRTGDLAEPLAGSCSCGRDHPLIGGIRGRESEIIITPEGRVVAPVAMDYAFYHLEEIREAQIVQEELDLLRVKVVGWDTLSPETLETLRRQMRDYLQSNSMRVEIEAVEEIPRTARGKKPFIISMIDREGYL